jgi:hypothetical protein
MASLFDANFSARRGGGASLVLPAFGQRRG